MTDPVAGSAWSGPLSLSVDELRGCVDCPAPFPGRRGRDRNRSTSLPRPRVLVATDEAETAERIRMILAREGCDVDTAGHAADALERFTQHYYGLLITSLRLRDLDGPGLYWALRARWPLAYPRVIFLVREGEDIPQSATGLEVPEAPVLLVPFTSEWLREMVRGALGLL